MSVTPTGSPAWTRTVGFADYGGNVDKENYAGGGAIDARTDVSAEEFSRLASDTAAVVRTAPLAVITYLNNDGVTGEPTIESALCQWGVRLTSYAGDAPPSGFPSGARQGDGYVLFTFSASYADEYAVSGAISLLGGVGTVHGTTFGDAVVTIASATTVEVRVFDEDGNAELDRRVTIELW